MVKSLTPGAFYFLKPSSFVSIKSKKYKPSLTYRPLIIKCIVIEESKKRVFTKRKIAAFKRSASCRTLPSAHAELVSHPIWTSLKRADVLSPWLTFSWSLSSAVWPVSWCLGALEFWGLFLEGEAFVCFWLWKVGLLRCTACLSSASSSELSPGWHMRSQCTEAARGLWCFNRPAFGGGTPPCLARNRVGVRPPDAFRACRAC